MANNEQIKQIELPPVLSHKELQTAFGFSRNLAYALLNRPDVGAFVLGGRHFIATETFLKWINSQGNKGVIN